MKHFHGPRIGLLIASAAFVIAGAACGSTSSASAASTSSAAPQTSGYSVTLSDMKVDTTSTLKAGKHMYTIANKGSVTHELVVFKTDLAPANFPMDANGDINEDGAGLTNVSDGDDIHAGKSQTREIDLTEPGTYVFLCNLPGHFKSGMYEVVTVS